MSKTKKQVIESKRKMVDHIRTVLSDMIYLLETDIKKLKEDKEQW
jgi:hypothetical protein